MNSIRTDIQVLRGVAILLVLLYHAGTGLFDAGYLGVDIFFVISGFLITSLIKTQVESGTFSFQEFYIRRAKRLLPAAYVTFFVVAIVSQFLLTSRELADLQKQVIGAVTLTGNIVLWQQTGYFEGSADLKPLLHVWSLAIEEQYYLLMPALLVVVPRRFWMNGALSVFSLSFAACLITSAWEPTAAFYLLPTRSWELAIGSVGALCVQGPKTRSVLRLLFWPSIFTLIVAPAIPWKKGPPDFLTLVVCVATLAVILRSHPVFRASPLWNWMARLGNISYSLYLVHWPIFAFINNSWIGEVPYLVRFVCISLSIAVAYCLYTYVEKPIRQLNVTSNALKPALVALSFTLTLTLTTLWTPRSTFANTDYEFVRRVNYGFGKACEYTASFSPKLECRNSDQPAILVWGDSFAMHLVPGLAETDQNLGIIQATRSVCGPLLGMSPLFKKNSEGYQEGYNRTWSENCIEFNKSVLEYLKKAPSVKIVVLSSPFGQYLDSTGAQILDSTSEGFVERGATVEVALEGLKKTVNEVRSLGKRIVVVAPPPAADFNIGLCLERLTTRKLTLGQFADCRVPVQVYHGQYRCVLEFLDRIPHHSGVAVIRFDTFLCGSQYCKTLDDDVLLYRDSGHLTYAGSRALAKKMGLTDLVRMTAR